MKKHVMKIGILPKDDYRKRTIAIARGKYKPRKGEPTVWFESMESLGQVLSGAREEASAPGAASVTLLDGAALAALCEQHGIGVTRCAVTVPLPDPELFDALRTS